ncbi:MAG: hypothetical protein LBR37_04465 [Erysipelotrichaceae bacterium]|jgi:hypothetical protein|nr:hypothetical protein [Erysipelotrichaceae bacterium]
MKKRFTISICFCLSLCLGIPILTSCDFNEPEIRYDDPAVQFVAKSIYNVATANNIETERMVIPLSPTYDLSRITIRDFELTYSYYFTAKIEKGLEPYFPLEYGSDFEFIYSRFTCRFFDNTDIITPDELLIIRNEDLAYAFIGSNGISPPEELPENHQTSFGTHIFLAPNMIVHGPHTDPGYDFNFSKTGEEINLDIQNIGGGLSDFAPHEITTSNPDSYEILPAEIVLDILESAYVEEKIGTATITRTYNPEPRLDVVSEQLTNLRAITYRNVIHNNEIIDRSTITNGMIIQFYYYPIYEDYNPTTMFIETIILL